MHYHVRWDIEIEAVGPREAAYRASRIQKGCMIYGDRGEIIKRVPPEAARFIVTPIEDGLTIGNPQMIDLSMRPDADA